MNSFIHIPDFSNTLQIRAFHFQIVEPGWLFDNHYHHYFELFHCIDGQVTEWLENIPYAFCTGDWLLIPPGVRHKTLNHSPSPFSYFSMMFEIDDPEFRRELKQLSGTRITAADAFSSDLPDLLSKVHKLLHRYQLLQIRYESSYQILVTDKLELQAYILLILNHVITFLQHKEHTSELEQTAHAFEVDMANRIENLIMNTLLQPDLSVQSIATHVGLSRSQCTKLFTKVFGISPRQYITSKRLLRAKEKLTESNLTIGAIAEELGFSSISHFSRQFKRWTGIPPLQYRPKHKTLSSYLQKS